MRAPTSSMPPWAQKYPIEYTPTVLVLDDEGREHHRNVGFVPPREFIADMLLGMAKAAKAKGLTAQAKTYLDKLSREYQGTKADNQAGELKRTMPA